MLKQEYKTQKLSTQLKISPVYIDIKFVPTVTGKLFDIIKLYKYFETGYNYPISVWNLIL